MVIQRKRWGNPLAKGIIHRSIAKVTRGDRELMGRLLDQQDKDEKAEALLKRAEKYQQWLRQQELREVETRVAAENHFPVPAERNRNGATPQEKIEALLRGRPGYPFLVTEIASHLSLDRAEVLEALEEIRNEPGFIVDIRWEESASAVYRRGA